MVGCEGGGGAGMAESESEVKCVFLLFVWELGAKVRVRVTKIPIIYIVMNGVIFSSFVGIQVML